MIAQAELTLQPAGARGGRTTVHDTGHASPLWRSNGRRDVPLASGPRRDAPATRGADPRTPPWQTGVPRDVMARATAGSASPPRAVDTLATGHHYTVTRWDVSLANVARVMYGDAALWPKIWLANLDQLEDPDVIQAGQRLRIPDKGPLTAEERAAADRYAARQHR